MKKMKIFFNSEIRSGKNITSDAIIDLILKNRKIDNIDVFLNPNSPTIFTLRDFGYDTEFKKVLTLLLHIRKENKMIVVYTDYDADGITGG